MEHLAPYEKIRERSIREQRYLLQRLNFDENREVPKLKTTTKRKKVDYGLRDKSSRLKQKSRMFGDDITNSRPRVETAPERDPFFLKAFRNVGGVTPIKESKVIPSQPFSKLVHTLCERKKYNIKEVSLTQANFWTEFTKLFGMEGFQMVPSSSPRYLERMWREQFCLSDGMKNGPHK